MLVLLLLLIVAFAAIGVFAAQNTGVMDVTLWQYHWTGIPQWLPVIAAAVGIAALFLLSMALADLLTGLRHGSIRRRISEHEAGIRDLRAENKSLREVNARLESEVQNLRALADRSVAATAAATEANRVPA